MTDGNTTAFAGGYIDTLPTTTIFAADGTTREVPVLTPESRSRLAVEMMDIARRAASNFRRRGNYPIEVEEFQSEALAVLVEAVRDYEPAQTLLPFGPWLVRRINWRLDDYVQKWYRLNRADYVAGRADSRRQVSLDAVDPADRKAEDPAARAIGREAARMMDVVLTRRERQIAKMRLYGGHNMREIADRLGLRHLHCRQIHSQSMRILREALSGGSIDALRASACGRAAAEASWDRRKKAARSAARLADACVRHAA